MVSAAATFQPVTADAAPTSDTVQGAIAYYDTLVSNGTIPTAWKDGSTHAGSSPDGQYTYVVTGDTGYIDTPTGGTIVTFAFDPNSGKVTSQPSVPGNPSWLQQIGIWIANGGSSTPLAGVPGTPSQIPGDVVQGGMDAVGAVKSIGDLVTAIMSGAFWKRVGIGAAGVLILIIGLVMLLRHRDTE